MRLLPLWILLLSAGPPSRAEDSAPKSVAAPSAKAPTAAEKTAASQKWLDTLEGDWKGDSKAALNGKEIRINGEESYHWETTDGERTLVCRSRLQIDLMVSIESVSRYRLTKEGDIEAETTSVDGSGEKRTEKGPIRIVGGGAFSKSTAPDGTLISYYSEKMLEEDGVKIRRAIGMNTITIPGTKPVKLRYDQTLKKVTPAVKPAR